MKRILFYGLLPLVLLMLLPDLHAQKTNTIKDSTLFHSYTNKADNFFKEFKYDSAAFYYKRSARFYKQNEMHKAYFEATLKICHVYRIKKDYKKALGCINDIENYTKFNIENFKYLYSEYLHHKGSVMGGQGYYGEAINILKGLINYRKSFISPPDTLAAKSYNNIGIYYYRIREYNKALYYYKINLDLDLMRKGNITYDLITDYNNIGNVYLLKGDFSRAIDYYHKALKLSKKFKNNPKTARTHHSLGNLYNRIGNYERALYHLKIARYIYVEVFNKNYLELGALYNIIGLIYWKNGEYEQSELYYNKALNIYRKNCYKSILPQIARVYNNLGLISIAKKEYNKGLENYKKSLQKQTIPKSKMIALRNISDIYMRLKEFKKAEKYLKKALVTYNAELDSNYFQYAQTLSYCGHFYLDQKLYDQALKNYKLTLEVYFKCKKPNKHTVAYTYGLIGYIYRKKKEYKLALKYYQKAICYNDFHFKDSSYTENPNWEHAISRGNYIYNLANKSRVLSKLYLRNDSVHYLNECLECYDLALGARDYLKKQIGENSKYILTQNTDWNFKFIYDILYHAFEKHKDTTYIEKAFQYMEKNKANILLASIRERDAITFSGIQDTVQELELSVKNSISAYKNHLYNESVKQKPDSDKIDLWNNKLFELHHQYDSIIKNLEHNYPKYYHLKHNHDVAGIAEVKEYLENDQLLINYILTDSAVYSIIVEKNNKPVFIKMKIDSTFHSNLNQLNSVKNLNIYTHTTDDYKKFIKSSHQVYKLLFGLIEQKIKNKRLIIIPSGELGYISFESLISKLPKPENPSYKNLDYLIRSNPISYSQSASLLTQEWEKQKGKAKNKTILVMAPDYSIDTNNIQDRNKRFKELKYAKKEAQSIIKIYKGDSIIGENATESKFKQLAGNYDIIHLAMHAKIDDQNPMNSKMIFSHPSDSTNDGYLKTHEVYGLELNAQLAVLSACNTGSGKMNKGEGIMSLARAFIYAGTRSIIMTLWNVDDKSGASIMTLFYKYLNRGYKKDIALQKAKLEYLSSSSQIGAHPFYWSSYVIVGNTQPLVKDYSLARAVVFTIIFLALIALLYYWRSKIFVKYS